MTPDHRLGDYRNRRVTVFGLGSFGGGLGAVEFLAARGARLTISDQRSSEQLADSHAALATYKDLNWQLGGHRAEDVLDAELVVVNPAVRRDHPLLLAAREKGIPLTSEINLFWQHNPAPVLAVTGSNGKSTTTAMLHNILQQTGRTVWLGGNIGRSLLPQVEAIRAEHLVLLELSSFQLTDLDRLQVSPHVSVVTNFSPNHLDWHDTLDHYRWAKQTMLRWQSPRDFAVLNADDNAVQTWPTAGQTRWFGLQPLMHAGWSLHQNGTVVERTDDAVETEVPLTGWLTLPGRHNLTNALAAVTAARCVGASLAAIEAGLRTYQPLPHRLQWVGGAAGRDFYNDSLATTPESTIVALEAFDRPIVLLAGGYDKQVDLSAMATAIAQRCRAVACMGTTGPQLRELITQAPRNQAVVSPACQSFNEAFEWAMTQSLPGDVIVLSPGCASYDWFRNFADRGQQFVERARQWIAAQAVGSADE